MMLKGANSNEVIKNIKERVAEFKMNMFQCRFAIS